MIIPSFPLTVSGSRFRVRYQVLGDERTAHARAEDICIEQTIEYPADLVPEGGIREHIFGRIESFESTGTGRYEAVVSYADEISGYEFPQLINVIFGNISMKPGLRVMGLDLSEALLEHFKGPRFGISGLRDYIGVHDRPLLFTAIKPLGLSPKQLGDMAYELAIGGIDIIKDDHGLANQSFADFKQRVDCVVEMVDKANAKTGKRAIYAPNVTGPFEVMQERIKYAKDAGATGLMLLPGLCSLDFVRSVAENDEIGLPIIIHPAFLGSYVLSSDFGVNHLVLHGQLARLAGADVTVVPNYIGRFSYSREDCASITAGCNMKMGRIKPIFPGPGGGIKPESFADMLAVYGRDVAYLISGNLHRQSPNLTESVKRFLEMLEKM